MKCHSCNKVLDKDDLEFGEPTGLCYECYFYRQQQEEEESRQVQVTKEMAMDAGEPSMEGMWIDW